MNRIKNTLLFLISTHLLALVFLSLFRLTLFWVAEIQEPNTQLGFQAFLMGLRFDNIISCGTIILPLVILFVALFFKKNNTLNNGILIFLCVLYSIVFSISAIDIPYFNQFFKHVNASIWNWLDEPSFVLNMIIAEPSYLVYGLLLAIVIFAFCWMLKKFKKHFLDRQESSQISTTKERAISISLLILCILLCILGVRGRLGQKSPIRIGTAYFCNNPFYNQLGLNPAYVLLRTTSNMSKENRQELHLIDDTTAIDYARKEFSISTDSLNKLSPVARFVEQSDSIIRKNVVIIMMESMASHFVADSSLTPFLNNLIQKSIYFPNAYSAGIHTMNGVYGTLFSYPALMNQHPFKTGDIVTYESWPTVMKSLGYATFYFTTHDEQFDNIGGYLAANNVETIVSEKDYPLSEVRSNLGVCDDYMFRVAIPRISQSVKDEKNFFAAFLTASNHPPFIIPEYFSPQSNDARYQVIEYADYSLQKFFEDAKKESWFENTIFALVGDHGASNNDYDISLAYHHVPIIIYDPSNETPRVIHSLAGQIDIFPTVMGMLGYQYINNTFGVDLLKTKRDYIYFSSDDAYCCVDSVDYYVCRNDGEESLYHLTNNDAKNYIQDYPQKAQWMKDYARSMIQAAQVVVKNKQN